MADAPLLIRQGEAARLLGVSRATLVAEIEAGRLRYVLVGKRRKFKPADLENYIERQGRGCDESSGVWSGSGGRGRRPITRTSRSGVIDFETALRQTTGKPPKS
jgi:excisionase family DNA binding protein